MDRRLSRRKLALAVGALVLAAPGVSACGFNYATDRSNTVAAGVGDQSGDVDVLNALIVSSADGSGTFIASLSNNSATNTYHLESLSFGSDATVQVAAFDPIEVKPHQLINLADGQGIKVAGSALKAGDFISLTLGFDNGQTSDLQVPIMAATYQYTDLDNGTGSPSPIASPTASPS
jgi:hypothetical protein